MKINWPFFFEKIKLIPKTRFFLNIEQDWFNLKLDSGYLMLDSGYQ